VSAPRLRVRRVGPVEAPLPSYQTKGSAGMDLAAALEAPITLAPGERRLVPTGLCLAIPAGHEAQVRPRSGLAVKHGIGMVNSIGTIDSDFRGEVGVILINLGQEPFVIEPLMRIAQLVVAPVVQVEVELVSELDATDRGGGGFGSTGV
jgi:dUTP pyrophosphatase